MSVLKFCRDCRDGFDSEELRNGRCEFCWVQKLEAKEGIIAVDSMMRRHRVFYGLERDERALLSPEEPEEE